MIEEIMVHILVAEDEEEGEDHILGVFSSAEKAAEAMDDHKWIAYDIITFTLDNPEEHKIAI